MPTTTVQKTTFEKEDGTEQTQYKITIPKALAEAHDIGGEEVEWRIESANRVSFSW